MKFLIAGVRKRRASKGLLARKPAYTKVSAGKEEKVARLPLPRSIACLVSRQATGSGGVVAL